MPYPITDIHCPRDFQGASATAPPPRRSRRFHLQMQLFALTAISVLVSLSTVAIAAIQIGQESLSQQPLLALNDTPPLENSSSFPPGQGAATAPLNAPGHSIPAAAGNFPRVVDRKGILTANMRTILAKELDQNAQEDGIEILVLTADGSIKKDGSDPFIQDLYGQLNPDKLIGVILCSASKHEDLDEKLAIYAGDSVKSLASEKALNEALAQVKAATIRETSSVPEALFHACRELRAQYRILQDIAGGATPRAGTAWDAAAAAAAAASKSGEAGSRKVGGLEPWKIFIVVFTIAAGALLIGIPRYLRRQRVFPEPAFQYRLCSPYSGGNNIRVDFR